MKRTKQYLWNYLNKFVKKKKSLWITKGLKQSSIRRSKLLSKKLKQQKLNEHKITAEKCNAFFVGIGKDISDNPSQSENYLHIIYLDHTTT